MVSYRSFCNKMWNATKFALMNLGEGFVPIPHYAEEKVADMLFVNKWILSQLNTCIVACDELLKKYAFGLAVDALCQFWTKVHHGARRPHGVCRSGEVLTCVAREG